MSSLRTRLFIALAAVVTLAGLISGLAIYWWAYGEAIELQDGLIVQVGSFLAERPVRPDLIPSKGVDPDVRVSVAELDEAPTIDAPPLAFVPKEIPDGLQTLDLQGKTWRVLVQTRRDGSRMVVGQPAEVRDEIAREGAGHAATSFAALIPCLMVLIALVIRYSFRPVSRLTEKLDRDRDGTPSSLPDKDLPDELRPFILAINRLIGRLADRLDRERRFIADAAHELRTPIGALTVQAQNLENAPNEADRIRRANELRTGLRRTAHLLDQLLDHARYAEGWARSSETVDISAIAKSTVADLLSLAEEKAVDLGFVRVDEARVRIAPAAFATIVQNLVGNALAYVPEGGRVDVTISVADGRATFLIEDDGPGIPAGEIQTIVKPFKRGTLAVAHGAGLGLSIVDRIVHSAGGRLDLGIRPNVQRSGLRVTVSLPLATP
jgi:two-component system, OmpR family, sensor kinase